VLLPTKYMEELHHNYVDSDQVRTCRSFTFLYNWTSRRMSGGDSFIPRIKSNIDPQKYALSKEFVETMRNGHVK
jgi:hypothetical protein